MSAGCHRGKQSRQKKQHGQCPWSTKEYGTLEELNKGQCGWSFTIRGRGSEIELGWMPERGLEIEDLGLLFFGRGRIIVIFQASKE